MAENFADLKDTIQDELRIDEWPLTQLSEDILEWLDEHPDQVPASTITGSKIDEAFGPEYRAWARMCLSRIGIKVIPDPEPTNAERWQELLAQYKDEATGLESFGDWADRKGLRAPEADDD